MNGAERLVHTLLEAGVDTCFANPGTSEMHFVAALDRALGMRCVLGLAEGVVTGAADGYYRLADRPAATLLHCGPGLANGLSNLHNARKGRSGIVNIVGDHATTHVALDAPLASDVAGIAAPVSHWVRRAESADALAADAREAVTQAHGHPGRVATLILPADCAWSPVTATSGPAAAAAAPVHRARPEPVDEAAVRHAAEALRRDAAATLLLLGDRALRAPATVAAGRIAAATGCSVMSAFYGARIERGAGRIALPRVPYAVDAALAALSRFRHIVLVGAEAPVAFFAYPGKPGRLAPAGCEIVPLASAAQDLPLALEALAEAVGAQRTPPRLQAALAPDEGVPDGALEPAAIAALVAARLPAEGIVVDEAISTGRGFDGGTARAAPHDWLTGMGGSIGFGLPVAVGAAIAAPRRRVLALEGDGSAMYTPQALWTMARESLDVTVLVFANRGYRILQHEFAGVGAGAPGARASGMLSLDEPALQWVPLAQSMGVPASRVGNCGELDRALRRSFATPGPSLVEVML